MKLIHLSDLHLGKRVNEFSMLEDQEYILIKILNIIDQEKPDGILIAGDVYDKSIPSVEAVQLLDSFLEKLAEKKQQVFLISGNHDSPERLDFASGLIEMSGIHISAVYQEKICPFTLEDEYGKVNIYLLPFIKPAHVRSKFSDETVETYTDAVRISIEHMGVDPTERNVIVTHQFVTGALRSESEEISVGGSDNVDASVFDEFDYVALGHIHGPQKIGRDTVRYCGTPLKYSFSEVNHQKSVTVVELREKGKVEVRTVELVPKRDMRELRGSYQEITNRKNYEGTALEDYLHITLTDEEDVLDGMALLRVIYPNLMKLDYDNRRTRENQQISQVNDIENKSPLELFQEFYEKQNNQQMSREQSDFAADLIERIWEGRE
ncbi:MAG: exonuclease SbcCD subunit D [Acetatifactor sp.]|nr:exonuclease SbcCD subunit D [Acetatifactor sp.]